MRIAEQGMDSHGRGRTCGSLRHLALGEHRRRSGQWPEWLEAEAALGVVSVMRRSMKELGCCKDDTRDGARESDRGADEPLQQRRLDRRDVVFRCQVRKQGLGVDHSFANFSRHVFKCR